MCTDPDIRKRASGICGFFPHTFWIRPDITEMVDWALKKHTITYTFWEHLWMSFWLRVCHGYTRSYLVGCCVICRPANYYISSVIQLVAATLR